MQERELYQEIPKLKSPWSVSQVTLNLEQQQVDVFVEHPSGTKFCCPECSESAACPYSASQLSSSWSEAGSSGMGCNGQAVHDSLRAICHSGPAGDSNRHWRDEYSADEMGPTWSIV